MHVIESRKNLNVGFPFLTVELARAGEDTFCCCCDSFDFYELIYSVPHYEGFNSCPSPDCMAVHTTLNRSLMRLLIEAAVLYQSAVFLLLNYVVLLSLRSDHRETWFDFLIQCFCSPKLYMPFSMSRRLQKHLIVGGMTTEAPKCWWHDYRSNRFVGGMTTEAPNCWSQDHRGGCRLQKHLIRKTNQVSLWSCTETDFY